MINFVNILIYFSFHTYYENSYPLSMTLTLLPHAYRPSPAHTGNPLAVTGNTLLYSRGDLQVPILKLVSVLIT